MVFFSSSERTGPFSVTIPFWVMIFPLWAYVERDLSSMIACMIACMIAWRTYCVISRSDRLDFCRSAVRSVALRSRRLTLVLSGCAAFDRVAESWSDDCCAPTNAHPPKSRPAASAVRTVICEKGFIDVSFESYPSDHSSGRSWRFSLQCAPGHSTAIADQRSFVARDLPQAEGTWRPREASHASRCYLATGSPSPSLAYLLRFLFRTKSDPELARRCPAPCR